MKLRNVSEAEKKQLREKARKEFPGDEMMQEIHYFQWLRHRQMEGFSQQERIKFYRRGKRPTRV